MEQYKQINLKMKAFSQINKTGQAENSLNQSNNPQTPSSIQQLLSQKVLTKEHVSAKDVRLKEGLSQRMFGRDAPGNGKAPAPQPQSVELGSGQASNAASVQQHVASRSKKIHVKQVNLECKTPKDLRPNEFGHKLFEQLTVFGPSKQELATLPKELCKYSVVRYF